MEKGTCNEDLDCFNPANVYAAIECVGYTSCSNGQCGVTCGPACKDGSEWSVCEIAPCESTTCASATSCTNDLCNGCRSIFFDAAGYEITSCNATTFTEEGALTAPEATDNKEAASGTPHLSTIRIIAGVFGYVLLHLVV